MNTLEDYVFCFFIKDLSLIKEVYDVFFHEYM